jgi:hypothetical protein
MKVRYISRRDGKYSAQLTPISKGIPNLSAFLIRSGLIFSTTSPLSGPFIPLSIFFHATGDLDIKAIFVRLQSLIPHLHHETLPLGARQGAASVRNPNSGLEWVSPKPLAR